MWDLLLTGWLSGTREPVLNHTDYEIVALVVNNWAVVGLKFNLIHNRVNRVLVFYELKRETIKRFNQSINQ